MNIAIIEDLKRDSLIITQYLQRYFSTQCCSLPLSIKTFENGESFLSTFIRGSYDFIFIDYYMERMSGMETARHIRKTDSEVILIFTTASRDFAIDAYKVKASGYLVKPFSYDELAEILSLIDLKQMKERQSITITSGYEQIQILINDIIYCDISGHYVQIHTNNRGLLRTRMTFSEISSLLEPYPEFLLCFRGCLINMNQVDHIDNLIFFMKDGARIPLRKKEQDKIMKVYADFIFEKVRDKNL